MPRIEQVHSKRHNPDDRYHTYTDCAWLPGVEELCVCNNYQSKPLCQGCASLAKAEIDRQVRN